MSAALSLADIQRAGVAFTADEAVAIVQRLILEHDNGTPEPPFGPPSLANVRLTDAGGVECRACEATPAVTEVAILLQAMLASTPHVPGGLRYAIARALHEVDAPPFDSVEEFSHTLSRYDAADRETIIRRLVERAQASAGVDISAFDRRRSIRSADELRRELRDADRRFYESRIVPIARGAEPRGRRLWVIGAVFAAAIALVGAGGVMRSHDTPAMPHVSAPSIASDQTVAVADPVAPVITARRISDTHPHPKHPVAPKARRSRLRWLHAITVVDDLAAK
ncbi:MAG TPA: hypothetical protein VFA59_13810 [Vicinamibacterales bacterium]|nr:hypothetical protein [Vicinamibacterales bacterium]